MPRCRGRKAVWWLASLVLMSSITAAQGPPKTLFRGPQDRIEGAIYQYRGSLRDSDKLLKGRFRVARQAISLVPDQLEAGKLREQANADTSGEAVEASGQNKRIGDVVELSDGATKLVFKDYEPLPGFAILRPVKDRRGLWRGYFLEMHEGQPGDRWKFEVSFSED